MHRCPECLQACYCHGDIDDCVVETEAYSSARCVHPNTHDCITADDDDGWFWDDDEDPHEPEYGFGPPMPDPDDLELGPVVGLFCSSCQRHTEHLVCESDGTTTEYRCSQCFAWSRGVTQAPSYDPSLHAEMTGEEGADVLPF